MKKILFKLKMSSKEDKIQVRLLNPLNWVFWPIFGILSLPFGISAVIVSSIKEAIDEDEDVCWWKER